MVPTKFGFEKNFAPKKILGPKEILCPKIIWFWIHKIFLGPMRFLAMKEFRYRKKSFPKKVLVQQNFWAKEIFGLKKLKKKLVCKNMDSKEILGPKIFF